jgi:nucleotidyltransferase/DNA polymerase involved in DNA repair
MSGRPIRFGEAAQNSVSDRHGILHFIPCGSFTSRSITLFRKVEAKRLTRFESFRGTVPGRPQAVKPALWQNIHSGIRPYCHAVVIRWSQGDQAALEELALRVQRELHSLARAYLKRGRPSQTCPYMRYQSAEICAAIRARICEARCSTRTHGRIRKRVLYARKRMLRRRASALQPM